MSASESKGFTPLRNFADATPQHSEFYECSERGAAVRFAYLYKNSFKHVEGEGWCMFDGKGWVPGADKDVLFKIMGVEDRVQAEFSNHASGSVFGAFCNWADANNHKRYYEAVRALAMTLPQLSLKQSDFDANPYLLCADNGVVDLRTGVLAAHSADHFHRRRAPVKYDPTATCPTFDRFIKWTMCDDQSLEDFLLLTLALGCSGLPTDRFFVWYGSGGNGKGVLANVIQGMLGDYAIQAPPDMFKKRKNDTHPDMLARLEGARFLNVSETGRGYEVDDVLLKQLTGLDTITARYMYQGNKQFRPTHTIVLQTNHKLRLDSVDPAIRRRMVFIPFPQNVDPDQQDPNLAARLIEEGPGILNRLVKAFQQYLSNNSKLVQPEKVKRFTDKMLEETDPVQAFLKDRVSVDGCEKGVQVKVMYEEYVRFCKEVGEVSLSMKGLNERLEHARLVKQSKGGNRVFWLGVSIRSIEYEPGTPLAVIHEMVRKDRPDAAA